MAEKKGIDGSVDSHKSPTIYNLRTSIILAPLVLFSQLEFHLGRALSGGFQNVSAVVFKSAYYTYNP